MSLRARLSAGVVAGLATLTVLFAPAAAEAAPAGCSSATHLVGENISGKGVAEFGPGGFCESSPDGTHWAIFQTDGNFVLYSTKGGRTHATWQSGTAGGRGKYLDFQVDGNMVVYGLDYYGHKTPLWASGTSEPPSSCGLGYNNLLRLTVQNDGNMVLYGVYPNEGVAWHTHTPGT